MFNVMFYDNVFENLMTCKLRKNENIFYQNNLENYPYMVMEIGVFPFAILMPITALEKL